MKTYNERAPRGPVQDASRLCHLHHKGRLVPRQVIARPNPRKELVTHAYMCAAAGFVYGDQ